MNLPKEEELSIKKSVASLKEKLPISHYRSRSGHGRYGENLPSIAEESAIFALQVELAEAKAERDYFRGLLGGGECEKNYEIRELLLANRTLSQRLKTEQEQNTKNETLKEQVRTLYIETEKLKNSLREIEEKKYAPRVFLKENELLRKLKIEQLVEGKNHLDLWISL